MGGGWSLFEVFTQSPPASYICPCCGAYRWNPTFREFIHPSSDMLEDLLRLEKHGVQTVQQLLAARPSELQRKIEVIPMDRLMRFRGQAQTYIWDRALDAWHHLPVGSSTEARRIGFALALQMSERERDEPIEVIIDMADKLSFDDVLAMSPENRTSTRRLHASRSQQQVVNQLELRQDFSDGGYLQVWLSNQMVAALTPAQILDASRIEAVNRITLGLPVRSCLDEAVSRISATKTLSIRSGKGQIVALLDSGVDASHPDLAKCAVKQKKYYVGSNIDDECGHGTHLAGVIASSHAQYRGVAPNTEIWSYRVLDKNGLNSSTKSLLSALQDLVVDAQSLSPAQMVIANCSFAVPEGTFATPQDYLAFCDSFDHATSDCVVVTAAGNSGPGAATITGPGSGYRVLTVGASVGRPGASLNFVPPYSSRGPAGQRNKPDVIAPGGYRRPKGEANKDASVVSSRLTGSTLDCSSSNEKPWQVDLDHYGLSGTSQATAMVSGVCALLLEEVAAQGRTVSHSDVANALCQTAQTLGFGPNDEGYGLVDVDAATSFI